MINKLTPEQEASLPAWRDKYLSYGLSTELCDRETAQRAVCLAYKCAGLQPPETFVWLGSPLQGAIGSYSIKKVRAQVRDQVLDQVRDQVGDQVWAQVRDQILDQVGDQVGDQVWDQVRDQILDQVWDQVRAQVRDQILDQILDQVRDQVRDQILDQVRDQVRDQILDQVWDQVRDQILDQVWTACYGSHDVAWIGFCSFFNQFGLAQKIAGLNATVQSCGWWWPFENLAVITERPSLLRRDNEHRLHSEAGPAISYPDGFSVHAWHGTRVPADWIESPEAIDPKIALTWRNVEQRRAAAEIIGWERVLRQLNARTIDKDTDPEIGELVEVEIPEIGRERFLRVRCGTGRIFALPVPPDMPTALAANAWTYDINPNLLKPEVRT